MRKNEFYEEFYSRLRKELSDFEEIDSTDEFVNSLEELMEDNKFDKEKLINLIDGVFDDKEK